MVENINGIHLSQLQAENEHYSTYNWLNLISSSTGILQQFSPKIGTVIVDRWELVTFIFEPYYYYYLSLVVCFVSVLVQLKVVKKGIGIMFIFYLKLIIMLLFFLCKVKYYMYAISSVHCTCGAKS